MFPSISKITPNFDNLNTDLQELDPVDPPINLNGNDIK